MTSIRRAGALLVLLLVASPLARADLSAAANTAFLALLNEARANAGQAPLIMNPALQAMAQDWSMQQVHAQRLAHRPIESQTAWIEARFTSDWQRVGENVGVGPSVESLHTLLMQSAKHRRNALGDFTHVGVGSVQDDTGRLWVTFNFVSTFIPSHASAEPVTIFDAPIVLRADLPLSSAAVRSAIATIEPPASSKP